MKFKQVYIEITNKCNLNCPFCPNHLLEKKEMSLEEIELIEEKINDKTYMLVTTACSNVTGEVLPIEEIGELCKKHKLFYQR